MKSFITSYLGLFARRDGTPAVDRIEIPIIQRDYAQGREGVAVGRIRDGFLDVLHAAVTGGEPVGLDFVYGDVENGTLRPLDGQQRLTTLFLLHWYLAFRAGRPAQEKDRKRFTYATRPSARLFCERLGEYQPPPDVADLGEWIVDQAWCLPTWEHDPTIRSMLVMLDAIHTRFRQADCPAAWERLADADAPAISFHLLPVEQMGLGEDLYIKMNSRGKPLTEFENFKARFEQVVELSCPDRATELAKKFDGAWADLLWPYRGDDSAVDDEFLRYLEFVTELCVWRSGGELPADDDIGALAERVYGAVNDKAGENVDFLIRAFDTWVTPGDVASTFRQLFAMASERDVDGERVVLFRQPGSEGLDLFGDCCAKYGEGAARKRLFTLPETLLLYGVLLHRLEGSPEIARRVRVLRNIVEASANELRVERMPAHLADVARIVLEGTLDGVSSLNQAQVAEERAKAELASSSAGLRAALFSLEDHPVLRGCLAPFELDAATLESRARVFAEVFSDAQQLGSLGGALLACGDYARRQSARSFQLGSSWNLGPWREVLTARTRTQTGQACPALASLLNELDGRKGEMSVRLEQVRQAWLESIERAPAVRMDWRYYLVKYPIMRDGRSGNYAAGNSMFELCMLEKKQMHGWYRDPYLSALHQESAVGVALDEPWFKVGSPTDPRWMRLLSGAELRCVEAGIQVAPPGEAAQAETFARVCAQHGVGEKRILVVPQVTVEGVNFDTEDRVKLGAALLRDLVAAGL